MAADGKQTDSFDVNFEVADVQRPILSVSKMLPHGKFNTLCTPWFMDREQPGQEVWLGGEEWVVCPEDSGIAG